MLLMIRRALMLVGFRGVRSGVERRSLGVSVRVGVRLGVTVMRRVLVMSLRGGGEGVERRGRGGGSVGSKSLDLRRWNERRTRGKISPERKSRYQRKGKKATRPKLT